MAIPDFAQGVKGTIFPMVDKSPWDSQTQTASAKPAASTAANGTAAQPVSMDTAFSDLLDIVNPLQHIPVVSTIYRASTGDQIGDFEQIAGDTLYGGPLGFVSSMADLAFKDFTGKNFGDTVLAMVTGDDDSGKPAELASNASAAKPQAQTPAPASRPAQTAAAQPPMAVMPAATSAIATAAPAALFPTSAINAAQLNATPDLDALTAAIKKNGLDADLGMRATLAYQQSLGLNGGDAAMPPPN